MELANGDIGDEFEVIDRAIDLAKVNGFTRISITKDGFSFEAEFEKSSPKSAKKTVSDEKPPTEPSEIIIKSNFVGYFKALEQAPIAGQSIHEGDSIGMITVLGISNEIESPANGKIREILVHDGQVVEYGQPIASIVAIP